MIELIIKMALCLFGALLLGFIIGWLLSKIFTKKRHKASIDGLTNSLLKSKEAIEQQEENHLSIETMFLNEKKELSLELENSQNEVKKIENKVTLSEKSLKESVALKASHQSLVEKNNNFKHLYSNSKKEIEGLEHVLIKAEEVLEERNKKIINLQKENNSKTYTAKEDELVVSKDQFAQIESQLLKYQEEISRLEKLNKNPSFTQKIEEKAKSELDDSAIVKLFGDTYKKIIKS